MKTHFLALLAATTAAFLTQPAAAQSSAFSVSGETTLLYNPASFTLGYSFTLDKAFSLHGLGIFDEGSDGLFSSYDVGLWDSAGTLLASSTVASGTAATLMDGYRWDTFGPLSLGAGSYRIGAVYLQGGQDPLYFENALDDFGNVVTAISGVTFGNASFARGGVLADPTVTANGSGGFFGPNLLLGVSAVPEPSSWAMMLLGFGAVGTMLRTRLRPPLRRARA